MYKILFLVALALAANLKTERKIARKQGPLGPGTGGPGGEGPGPFGPGGEGEGPHGGNSTDCAPGCPDYWIGDDYCDVACANEACGNDAGDCEGQCNAGCPEYWIGDGVCDHACNVEECGNDEGDCDFNGEFDGPGSGGPGDDWEEPEECAPGCPENWIGDGICDHTCLNDDCEQDAGDCDFDGEFQGPGFGGPGTEGPGDWEPEECAPGCPVMWIGDDICDDSCLNDECDQDGGDCDGDEDGDFQDDA